jgi:hypothetical protein
MFSPLAPISKGSVPKNYVITALGAKVINDFTIDVIDIRYLRII